jgi:late competence protein required for DNA uptake (superfamily II DNA/RNA helicase)
MSAIVLESTLTCPRCGHVKIERMPRDVCQWYYVCERCHALLRPKAGDCCVFCSYGSVPCPPVQAQRQSNGCGCHTD